MADRKFTLSEVFENDSQLQQYYLEGVIPTKRILGSGSYGSVVEVKYGHVSCAAKRMHKLLLDPGNDGVENAIVKYRQECQLMAGLRHPNITQFLGLCFLEGSELPLLVMEKLEMSVDDLLECARDIPLAVKISIVMDTCSGLVYLHGMPSPIVHRDLTARNVLLTSSLTAKITDMGNSRIMTLKPAQLVQTMSKVPGTLVYMPPEALNDSHKYGPSLDMFSFGHLALYILTEVFPGDLLSATHVDPNNSDHVIGRTEIDRRKKYIMKLKDQFFELHPVLFELIKQCLHNRPQARPSSEQLLGILQQLKKEINVTYGETLVNATHVLQVKEIKQKERRIMELERYEVENVHLSAINAALKNEQSEMETSITRLQGENNQLLTEIRQLISLNRHLEAEKVHLEACHQLEVDVLQLEVAQLKKELNNWSSQETLTFSQQDWKRGPDMPVGMSVYIQAVQINDMVYVGGGWTAKSDDYYIIMTYNIKSHKWHTLPSYKTRWFAMSAINNKLILIGGKAKDDSYSDELGEWQTDSKRWIYSFPCMPTPRHGPSATSYKHWLVVAGGYHGAHLQTVEILNVLNMQWSSGQATPKAFASVKSTTIGDTWYLIGGISGNVGNGANVYSVSLEALISHSDTDASTLWTKLPSPNFVSSCPLNIRGSLLAFGGMDVKSFSPVSDIQRYVPESNQWVQAGQLPIEICNCTCIVTSSNEVLVVGGEDGKSALNSMFTFSIF